MFIKYFVYFGVKKFFLYDTSSNLHIVKCIKVLQIFFGDKIRPIYTSPKKQLLWLLKLCQLNCSYPGLKMILHQTSPKFAMEIQDLYLLKAA